MPAFVFVLIGSQVEQLPNFFRGEVVDGNKIVTFFHNRLLSYSANGLCDAVFGLKIRVYT